MARHRRCCSVRPERMVRGAHTPAGEVALLGLIEAYSLSYENKLQVVSPRSYYNISPNLSLNVEGADFGFVHSNQRRELYPGQNTKNP